jgi:hypothetical protein
MQPSHQPDRAPMVERRDRHERMFSEAKKNNRSPATEDPRKQRYAKLVARTESKYRDIAAKRGVTIESPKRDDVKEQKSFRDWMVSDRPVPDPSNRRRHRPE